MMTLRLSLLATALIAPLLLAGCGTLGLGGGDDPPVNAAEAASNYRAGAALYDRGRSPAERAEGARLILIAADQGDADAAYRLGATAALRPESQRDDASAMTWLRRAAIDGHAEAQYAYATGLAEGRGVPREPEWAAMWMGRAAHNGSARARRALASFYARGVGLPVDAREAARWSALASRPSANVGLGDFPDEPLVRFVQHALARQGDYRAPVTGAEDAATRAAALAFARRERVSGDGSINADLVQRLRDRLRAPGA
jgi:Sel1 repeat